MSSIWRCLTPRSSRKQKLKEKQLTDGPSEEAGTARQPPPATLLLEDKDNNQPLSKEELLASLQIEYEDSADDVFVESTRSDEDLQVLQVESLPQFRMAPTQYRLSAPEDRMAIPYSMSVPLDNSPSDEIINLEAGTSSVKRSYLSIVPTTIQQLSGTTTLFVWHAYFHPAIGRRFSNILISIKFSTLPSPPPKRPDHAPSITAYAPHKSFGSTSSEQTSISWGLELPVSVPAGPVSIGATPSVQNESKKEIKHAFTIAGSTRGISTRHTLVWTVEENASTERGVPSELQLAALVVAQPGSAPMVVETDISGRTAGGYLPSHNLRPKTDAAGRRKVIDPKLFTGLLFEYDFEGEGIAGAKKLLQPWTGKVDGAVLEFDQDVMRA